MKMLSKLKTFHFSESEEQSPVKGDFMKKKEIITHPQYKMLSK